MIRWLQSWHMQDSEELNSLPDDLFRKYPSRIAKLGYVMFKRTGRYPSPEEVAQADPEWIRVINTIDAAIEALRPKK